MGCENSQGDGETAGGALYDTAMIICKGVQKRLGVCENGQGVHYVT